jgi:Hint domain
MAKQLNHRAAVKKLGVILPEAHEAKVGTSRRALLLGFTTFSVAMAAQASKVANAKNRKHAFRYKTIHGHKKHRSGGGRPACYLEGTYILTPAGEVRIEDLQAGDLVQLYEGGYEPIKQVVGKTIQRNGNDQWDIRIAPICFKRGSLAEGVPHTDLYVSRAHCFLIDGYLVPAATLVNWHNIVACDDFNGQILRYFHIELANHNVVIANGAPAETLLPGSEILGINVQVAAKAERRELFPYAPIIGLEGTGKKAASFARSIISPFHDIRQPVDRIRDALHFRAILNS